MGKRKIFVFLLLYYGSFLSVQVAGASDTVSFSMVTRLSFYTYEKNDEVLLHIPNNLIYTNISVSLKIDGLESASWKGTPGKKILRIPFHFNLTPLKYVLTAFIRRQGSNFIYKSETELIILPYKSNEVKTDRLTGGLIVNRKQFFPFGFYCYSPVYPTLPEEEVVKGFNMISPYQKILPQTLKERKAYMDRCAQLGMKVHYNLLSVSGGGGTGSGIDAISETEKISRLLEEIRTFRDHPALLAWYIADEPTGNRITPDSLRKIYMIVKHEDPWHPVSIVFMAPFLSSKKYADALDIVMADPYPVPGSPVSMVGDVAGSLSAEFSGKKSVWIVPQAFGGSEWWEREPTYQEIRSMTYQSIIKGARGIQYFIRQGLNIFPKSASSWAECGRIAAETAELTPWLLSDEETLPARTGNRNIILTSAMHNGQLMIIAANRTNSPQSADFYVSAPWSGKVKVIFENRTISAANGYFTDQLQAFGTQVYLLNIKPLQDNIRSWKDNLILDPGFEDTSSPGVPASCYAASGGDRGSTYFIDSREHLEGNHSLRLITPVNNYGNRLKFFPVRIINGRTYFISVWAKGDPEQGLNGGKGNRQYFRITTADIGSELFVLSDEWKKFVTNVTIPNDYSQPPRINLILQMPSEGVAWFDMLQMAECIDMNRCINPELINNSF